MCENSPHFYRIDWFSVLFFWFPVEISGNWEDPFQVSYWLLENCDLSFRCWAFLPLNVEIRGYWSELFEVMLMGIWKVVSPSLSLMCPFLVLGISWLSYIPTIFLFLFNCVFLNFNLEFDSRSWLYTMFKTLLKWFLIPE